MRVFIVKRASGTAGRVDGVVNLENCVSVRQLSPRQPSFGRLAGAASSTDSILVAQSFGPVHGSGRGTCNRPSAVIGATTTLAAVTAVFGPAAARSAVAAAKVVALIAPRDTHGTAAAAAISCGRGRGRAAWLLLPLPLVCVFCAMRFPASMLYQNGSVSMTKAFSLVTR